MAFLQELASISTLRRAWESVAAKRGVAGIDRVSVTELGGRLDTELETLSQEIRGAPYRPSPVLRIRPPFLAASERALVVPAVRDRIVLRAIADLLVPVIDPLLSPSCSTPQWASFTAYAMAGARSPSMWSSPSDSR
jgi:retron-type reverse transcriptase